MNMIIRKGQTLFRSFLPRHSPEFLIVGAQKAATSSLHYYLSQHPQLNGSFPKEVHFFDKWINYGFDKKWYEGHFRSFHPHSFNKKKNTLFFESSPNYIYYEDVAEKIKEYYPSMKLILILRNPISRAYSAWNMYRDMFNRKKPDFSTRGGRFPNDENAIYKYLMKDRGIFPNFRETIELEMTLMEENVSAEPSILRRGVYINQIKSYLKFFDFKQMHIVGFNEIKQNLSNVLKEIEVFLKVGSFGEINISVKNARRYIDKMNALDYQFLADFYKKYNSDLFNFIGRELNW